MRTQGVVIVYPLGEQVAHLAQGSEEAGIEHFAAKQAVDTLDIGVLSRFARLNPVQGNALRFVPLARGGADELGTVVAAPFGWLPVLVDELGQQARHAGCRQGEAPFDAQHLAVEIVADVERAEAAAVGERVAGEVERPAPVGPGGGPQGRFQASGQAALFAAPAQLRAQGLVEPPQAFVVGPAPRSCASAAVVGLPEAPPGATGHQRP